MTRGRKKLPQELLVLRGTDRKDRQRSPSVSGNPIKLEEVYQRCQVSGLRGATDRARKIYWAKVRQCATLGILEETSCSQLLFYAIEYDHFITCSESIRKDGAYLILNDKDGNPRPFPNPAVKQRENALAYLLKIGSNFGFSPVDKQRIHLEKKEDPLDNIRRIMTTTEIEFEDGPDDQ